MHANKNKAMNPMNIEINKKTIKKLNCDKKWIGENLGRIVRSRKGEK